MKPILISAMFILILAACARPPTATLHGLDPKGSGGPLAGGAALAIAQLAQATAQATPSSFATLAATTTTPATAPAGSATLAPTPGTPQGAPVAGGAFFQIGNALNRDPGAAAGDYQMAVGSLQQDKPANSWITWAEKQGNTQQIFVSKQNGNAFEPVSASLNIHANVVAEAPSITFAGPNRTVPWVAWYEPSPRAGASQKQVFASRFNATSGLWLPVGQDRGGNEPSLNIHTNQLAQDPHIVGGSADPTQNPAAWVCWQEVSSHNTAVEIFVSRAISDTTALGGFRWLPVGLNRSGSADDPEPSVNLDVTGGSNSDHCKLAFAETNNAVPWVVWAEKIRLEPTQIFVARAVADNTQGAGGFKWQFVPNCTAQEFSKCSLNVNPTKDGFEPSMAAGTVIPGQATVPWIAWTEVGTNGKRQVFVNRLDQVSRNAFINVGGSLNVDPSRDAHNPDITFIGNVPFVAWDEDVSGTRRIFVRHLASDPQTGTWVLDTPREGLAVDKSAIAVFPNVRGSADGKVLIAYIQGDFEKELSKVLVCTNATLTSWLTKFPGLAAPPALAQPC